MDMVPWYAQGLPPCGRHCAWQATMPMHRLGFVVLAVFRRACVQRVGAHSGHVAFPFLWRAQSERQPSANTLVVALVVGVPEWVSAQGARHALEKL